ncbi:hypothetical protein [Rheinheimera aquimaris]|uniref:phage tail tube protein n=1 Tax=Rheinheimera aquimaris TaxID=412437 RepID=UPI001E4F0075|nr:hypothetical protein [Rheinheimera aquimaris]MCD1597863.1 hypothetical protein [Rheinheimera aquimaris]
MSGLMLSGNIFIDRLTDTGASTGLIGPINVTQLAINTPSNEAVRSSKKKASYGQALDVVKTAQPTEVTIAFDDQPAELLAMALLGDTAEINQGSGTATDEAVTLPANGRWAKLAHSNLAEIGVSGAIVSPAGPLAVATDIEINYAAGLVRAKKGGAMEAGGAITLTYQYNAISGISVKGGLRPQIRARILGDMKNLATGKNANLDIPEASLAPTNAVDFMASEFVTTTLAGKIKLLDGKDAPFEYHEL